MSLDVLMGIAARAGRSVIEAALTLWYCMKDPATPFWIKSWILGDLAYLVSPLDALPDFTPLVGFGDDLGLMTATLAAIAIHVKPEHRSRAAATLREWFDRGAGMQNVKDSSDD